MTTTSHAGKYAKKTSAMKKQITRTSHAGKNAIKTSGMRKQITKHPMLENM